MALPVASSTSPLRPKRRSAPASTSADAYHIDDGPSMVPPIQVRAECDTEDQPCHHMRPHTRTRHKALTIHTSEISPTSSPSQSPNSRPRPLPRVPQSAPCDLGSTSFRRLPPTPASSSPSSFLLQPEQLPPRKESLRPLLTPVTLKASSTSTNGCGATAVPPKTSPRGFITNHGDIQPISPANTIASMLIFRRDSDESDDEDTDEVADAGLRRRRWRDTRPFVIKSTSPHSHIPPVPPLPASLSPGIIVLPRESRHWYREEKGALVEQDYDQVLRSLRKL